MAQASHSKNNSNEYTNYIRSRINNNLRKSWLVNYEKVTSNLDKILSIFLLTIILEIDHEKSRKFDGNFQEIFLKIENK